MQEVKDRGSVKNPYLQLGNSPRSSLSGVRLFNALAHLGESAVCSVCTARADGLEDQETVRNFPFQLSPPFSLSFLMGFQGDSSPLGLELRKLQLYLTVHKQPLDQKAFKDSNDRAPSLPALQFYYYQILNWRRHPDRYIQDCSLQLESGIESRKKAIESTLLASIQNICEGLLYNTLTQQQLVRSELMLDRKRS